MSVYEYRATITSVYDADTVRARLDLGFRIYQDGVQLRLYGINAPEMQGETLEAARRARDALRFRVLGRVCIIRTYKDAQEKYGRYLATVMLDGEGINDWLVREGHATVYLP